MKTSALPSIKTLKIAGLLALPLLLSNCVPTYYDDAPAGSGIVVTEQRSLRPFSRIALDGDMRVTIKSGPAYAAYITTDDNLTDYVETNTFGDELTVDMGYGVYPLVQPEVTIIVPEIRSVIHNGEGVIEIEEDGNFPNLSIELNGSGAVYFSGTASLLRADLNGSGSIFLEGYAATLVADLSGYGQIRADDLLVGDADVVLSGSGNVYLDLDYRSTLDLSLTGSGRVEWWGAPETLNYNLTGSGKVVEHRGLPKRSAGLAKGAGKTGMQSYEEVAKRVVPKAAATKKR